MRGRVTGTIAALALRRRMATLLFGAGAHDPLTFGGFGLLLLLFVSLVAAHSALRATHVDPVIALRTA